MSSFFYYRRTFDIYDIRTSIYCDFSVLLVSVRASNSNASVLRIENNDAARWAILLFLLFFVLISCFPWNCHKSKDHFI